TMEEVYEATKVNRWFLQNIFEISEFEHALADAAAEGVFSKSGDVDPNGRERRMMMHAKQLGFADKQLGVIFSSTGNTWSEWDVRARRLALGVKALYKSVDTCGGEFEAHTPY